MSWMRNGGWLCGTHHRQPHCPSDSLLRVPEGKSLSQSGAFGEEEPLARPTCRASALVPGYQLRAERSRCIEIRKPSSLCERVDLGNSHRRLVPDRPGIDHGIAIQVVRIEICHRFRSQSDRRRLGFLTAPPNLGSPAGRLADIVHGWVGIVPTHGDDTISDFLASYDRMIGPQIFRRRSLAGRFPCAPDGKAGPWRGRPRSALFLQQALPLSANPKLQRWATRDRPVESRRNASGGVARNITMRPSKIAPKSSAAWAQGDTA